MWVAIVVIVGVAWAVGYALYLRSMMDREERKLHEQERLRLEHERREQERFQLAREQERLRLEREQERLRLEREQERLRLEREQERLRLEREQERLRLERLERLRAAALSDFMNDIARAVASHIDVLSRKYKQLAYQDDYGKWKFDAWERERAYFVTNVLAHEVHAPADYVSDGKEPYGPLLLPAVHRIIAEQIEEHLRCRQDGQGVGASIDDVVTGEDYEHFCRAIVEKAGWTVRTTPRSGDQGLDLVCEYRDVRLGLQCKFYTQPVGNSAVQEVVAGVGYYQAALGAVVTNSTFTLRAQQLAQANNIRLLHHDELGPYAERVARDAEEQHAGVG